MLPLLAAVCVWTSGCGSLESAVESSTTTATTATETTTETTVAETTTTSATETTTASATEIATEIAAIPTTEATDDAAAIEVFACTAGTWYMDGDPDTASLVMDGVALRTGKSYHRTQALYQLPAKIAVDTE